MSRRKHSGVCIIEGCGRKAHSRPMCSMHNNRVRKTGDPGPVGLLRRENGTGRIDSNGHHVVTVDGRRVGAHRIAMEEHLSRPLWPDESVHHRNGNRSDNRIENLELWSRYQPAGQRVEDKIGWAAEILRRYAPDLLADPTSVPAPAGRAITNRKQATA